MSLRLVSARRAALAAPILAPALAFMLSLPAVPARADVFIHSDDYKDGEEITGVFFGDEEYAKLVDDFERNGQEFDWGWALTPDWEAKSAAAADQGKKKKGFFGRFKNRGPEPEQEPDELAFDLGDYQTVRVPAVENFSGIMKDDELASVRESLELAMKQAGLKPVESGPADLELSAAVVDINREGGGFGLIQVDPFIEIEIRLRDLENDRDLLLLRNQEHGDTPTDAALEYASQIAIFLR
jgi:hypothetical protein